MRAVAPASAARTTVPPQALSTLTRFQSLFENLSSRWLRSSTGTITGSVVTVVSLSARSVAVMRN